MSGPRDEQAERIVENLRDIDYNFRGMNYDQFQDLFEDRDPVEFL
jgi:hypothetical protein